MNVLSLFTGAGGGEYGSILLGWRTVGYVEYNDYRQQIIRQRIKDGIFDDAQIFGDIQAFIDEGFAESYKGLVDIISAGFPCQPFSSAGKQLGAADPRNMWPATIECIRLVRPRDILLENVSKILTDPYMGTILGDLAESGYYPRWDCIPASAVGANHQRDRLWLTNAGRSRHGGILQQEQELRGNEAADTRSDGEVRPLPDADKTGCEIKRRARERRRTVACGNSTAGKAPDSDETRRGDVEKPHGLSIERQQTPRRSNLDGCRWWSHKRRPPLLDDGVANWRKSIEASGDGQVPAVVVAAWNLLRGKD